MLTDLATTADRPGRLERVQGADATQPARARISLDGQWSFWADPDEALSAAGLPAGRGIEMTVPGPWQAQAPELNFYSGAAWYQRTLEIPAAWLAGSAVVLGIGAADYLTTAWLNGIQVGAHEGGYLPFEFDVTGAARAGANLLTIRVDDPPGLFPEVPHGKQGWYGPLSGIWQSVWIERRAQLYIQDLQIRADPEAGSVVAGVELSAPLPGAARLVVRALDPAGAVAAAVQVELPPGQQAASLQLAVPEPQRWSPDAPHLYTLEARLDTPHTGADAQVKNFGFRKIEARAGKLYLNGRPVYLRGALDQDYYLDSLATPPSLEFLEDQIRKAKELGLNCLRCHIKAADPRYYEAADRLGMLIWTELPNWSVLTDVSAQRGRATLEGILRRDGHHPSIVIWTILNENWGTDLVGDPSHRAWLKETYDWLKALDPTRLVVDNSPCLPNFHVQTDLEDFHFYRAIPDQRRDWDRFVKEFAGRPPWTFSPAGDIVRTGQEPLIVSEFGNWGLPDADLLADEQGRDPWWFETGLEWSQGVVYPQGVRRRFHSLGLEKPFGSWSRFIEATQWQQYLALKYEIEAIRRQPEITGYVITELTDVHWECNGLLDMRRSPKVFHLALKNVNADTVIIPDWERVAYWSGESVQVGIQVAHAAGEPLEPGSLRWRLGSGPAGELDVPALQPGQVTQVGRVVFPAPELDNPAVQKLALELRTAAGRRVTANDLELSFSPRRPDAGSPVAPPTRTAALYCDDGQLGDRLQALGYRVTADLEQAHAAVTGQAGASLLAFVHQGGRLLVLADRAGRPGPLLPGIQLEARQGTPWTGDWASAFSWLNRQGAFAGLPGGPLIDHSFDRVIPEYVLTGFRDWDFRSSVHAGLVVGWIHKPAVLIGERYYGRGKAVLNTFRLDDQALGSDPTATILLDGLIELTLC